MDGRATDAGLRDTDSDEVLRILGLQNAILDA